MRRFAGWAGRFRALGAVALVCAACGGALALAAPPQGGGAAKRHQVLPSRLDAATARLSGCAVAFRRAGCGVLHRYLTTLEPCISLPRSQHCQAAVAFAHAPRNLRGGRAVQLNAILVKLGDVSRRLRREHPTLSVAALYRLLVRALTDERPGVLPALVSATAAASATPSDHPTSAGATPFARPRQATQAPVRALSARLAAVFPVLKATQSAQEAHQLAKVRREAARSSIFSQGLAAAGANIELARRDYSSPNGDAGYLIPGRNGNVCSIHLYHGHVSGASCTTVDRRLEENGSIGMMVVSGGYEVYGELPAGTRSVRVTDAQHHVYEVQANRWGGFDFVGRGVMSRLEAQTAAGLWRLCESGAFPPPPPNEPKPPRQGTSSGGR